MPAIWKPLLLMDDPRFRFVRADIADAEAVDRLFEEEKPDIVVNFAAESHVDLLHHRPLHLVRTNVMGTQVLMESCRKYAGAALPPGIHRRGVRRSASDRPDLFFTEETPLHTSSPHSASKAGADLLVLAYARTLGLPVSITRCSNNYGPLSLPRKLDPPDDLPRPGGSVPARLRHGEKRADWLYVEDHCAAIMDPVMRLP